MMAKPSHYPNQAKLKGKDQRNVQQSNSTTEEVKEFTV